MNPANKYPYSNGSLVKINNREHVWHDEIAIIRDHNELVEPQQGSVQITEAGEKPFEPMTRFFYRIEILGRLTWVPGHWLLPTEDDESN